MCEQSDLFTSADLQGIKTETFVERVEFARQMSSTSDVALRLASQSDLATPALVLTELQTAGRGRGENQWWSRRGALTFSLLLREHVSRLPARQWPQISLMVGLAVCRAIEQLVPDVAVALKWPNDVLIQGRKVGGILIEVPSQADAAMVIGVGINVNNSLQKAPYDVRANATSLIEVTGTEHCLTSLLIGFMRELERLLVDFAAHQIDLAAHWKPRCLLTGKRVRIDVSDQPIEGTCRGIQSDGALIVETSVGLKYCYAGVVRWYERSQSTG